MKFLDKLNPLGLLVLRVALGASFMFHGYPKLRDPADALRAFPGYGLPGYFGYIFAILEVFGGGLLILGLLTRVVALLMTIEMGLILNRILNPPAGLYAFGRYEMPLLLGAMALALVTTGAGAISIDAFMFKSGRKSTKKSKTKD